MTLVKARLTIIVAAAALFNAVPTLADPDKDESGKGRGYHEPDRSDHHRGSHYRSEGKEEFFEGNCKVERKWEKSGEYKEERKCHGGHYSPQAEHPAAPGVVITLPPIVVLPAGR